MTWPYWPLKLRTSSSHEEGCEREFAISTKEFIGEKGKVTGLKTVHVEFKDGKMVEIAGTEKTYKADLVLLAMGFVNPVASDAGGFGVDKDARGNAKATTDFMGGYATNVPKVFAAGDMRRGQSPGGVGDSRRAPGRALGGRVPDGLQRPAALTHSNRGAQGLPESRIMQKAGACPAFVFMNPNNNDALVELRNLTFGYGERVILDDVSLRYPEAR